MTRETFEKKRYVYSIRHLYGLEGKRHDRAPYSCAQIATAHPAKCPLVGWDDSATATLLRRIRPGMSSRRLDRVLASKRHGRRRDACGQTLWGAEKATDGNGSDGDRDDVDTGDDPGPAPTFDSPNDYYEAALVYTLN